jgi:hypothetical protein
MAAYQPLGISEGGIVVSWEQDGACMVIRDGRPDGIKIRNRGGEVVAKVISESPRVRILDMKDSQISDNGVGHVSLVLRQTNQLEELYFASCGHVGLEFLIGIVKRCTRLHTLRVELVDEPTRQRVGKNLRAADFDTSAYVREMKEGEEEEGEDEEDAGQPPADEEEAEERENKRIAKLQKLFASTDYDSDNENGRVCPGGKAPGEGKGPSANFVRLLGQFVDAVAEKDNLLNVEIVGDGVPADVRLDLSRALDEHQVLEGKRAAAREEKAVRTAYDALKDQMNELNHGSPSSTVEELLNGADGMEQTRLGMRSYVNRRLFAALGEALFECQRFKSKENESVSTAQGEMAFIAYYIRKQAALIAEENKHKKRHQHGATAN